MTETVFELFEAAARRVPEGACLCAPPMAGRPYHPDGVEIGYGEARERVAALGALYRAAGYGRGHRVALLLENRPEFPPALVGAQCALAGCHRADQPGLPAGGDGHISSITPRRRWWSRCRSG